MTAMHEQRYATSSTRNVDNFIKRGGHTYLQNGTLSKEIHWAHFAGMELDDLKHHVGIRQKDTTYDLKLGAWLGPIKDHALKNKIVAKSHKKAIKPEVGAVEAIDIPLDSEAGKIAIAAVAKAETEKPHAKAGPRAKQVEAFAEVKNADQRRAEAMAAKPQRQPRLTTKH